MKPSLGRIVLYALTIADADRINRRREVRCQPGDCDLERGPSVAETIGQRLNDGTWPEGAQAHVGNRVGEGQQCPAMIVAVWGEAPDSAVNLKVELDGTDVYWAKSVTVNQATDGKPTPGQYDWPTRGVGETRKAVPPVAAGTSPAGSTGFVDAQAVEGIGRTDEEKSAYAKANPNAKGGAAK